MAGARKADHVHARGDGCLDPVHAVFDHQTFRRGDAHRAGSVKEDIGRRLARGDNICAEGIAGKVWREAGGIQLELELGLRTARCDTAWSM